MPNSSTRDLSSFPLAFAGVSLVMDWSLQPGSQEVLRADQRSAVSGIGWRFAHARGTATATAFSFALAFLTFILEVFEGRAHFVQEHKLRVGRELLIFDQMDGETVREVDVGLADKAFSQQGAEPGGRVGCRSIFSVDRGIEIEFDFWIAHHFRDFKAVQAFGCAGTASRQWTLVAFV